jgi:hypothetical protein
VDHPVVGRVEALALERRRELGDAPVVLVADHAGRLVAEADLAALEVEGVAVAVARERPEAPADVVVLLQVAQVLRPRDVAPDEVARRAVPGAALGPERAGVEALDGRVAELREALVEGDDVRVGVALRLVVSKLRAKASPDMPVAAATPAAAATKPGGRSPPGRPARHALGKVLELVRLDASHVVSPP